MADIVPLNSDRVQVISRLPRSLIVVGGEIGLDLSLPEELPKAIADRGWVKLVVEAESHRILGVHLLAAEVIHEAIFIVKSRLTVEEVCRIIHVYPTVAESILRAAEAYPKAA